MPAVVTLMEADEIGDNPYSDPEQKPDDEGLRTLRSQYRILARDQRVASQRAALTRPQRLAFPFRRLAVAGVEPAARHVDLGLPEGPHQRACGMPFRRSMLAGVAGQKPGRPQFVGIAKFLRLPARQRHQPCLRLKGDRRLPTGARAIIECSHRAFSHGALDAALNRLMMQPEHPADREERRIFPIGQQYPRALYPARRLRSRLRYRYFSVSASPSDNSIARRHAAMTFHPLHYGHTRPI
jgi:hypothetical protein